MHRMGLVHVAPQHVRVLVGAGDVEEEQALAKAIPFVLEKAYAVLENQLGLLDIALVVKDAVVEGLGVRRQPLGPERSDRAGNLTADFLGMGDRHCLRCRVDVDGSDIQLQVRVRLLEVEAADARDTHQARSHSEPHLRPAAVLALLEQVLLALDRDQHGSVDRIDIYGEGD